MSDAPQDVTRLLLDRELNPNERAERLLPLVYEHLRGIARQRMAAERADHTLQATALVHEAYLRLLGANNLAWSSRAHFYFAAGRAMQRILVDHARARRRAKRGGGPDGPSQRVPLSVVDLADEADPEEILALDEAFCRFQSEEPEAAAVVSLRFFAGLSGDDTAAALGISSRQVDRLWAFARAWLYRNIEQDRHPRQVGDGRSPPHANPGDLR